MIANRTFACIRTAGAALILLLVNVAAGKAQIYSASITGVVTDPEGAVVPGAKVTVKNTDTNETREMATSPDGRYTFSRLIPGPYDVAVELRGFKRAARIGIQLQGSQAAEINFPLDIGQVNESVKVTASAVSVDTQTANQSVTFNYQDVLDAPLNMRSPLSLVFNTAGVVNIDTGDPNGGEDSPQDQSHNHFSINGGRDISSLIMIDGVVATAADWGGVFATPSVDSTEEVQILRNTYDAEYGRTGGGVVSIVTRGGSNAFHGSAWEYLRNDKLQCAGRHHQFSRQYSAAASIRAESDILTIPLPPRGHCQNSPCLLICCDDILFQMYVNVHKSRPQ